MNSAPANVVTLTELERELRWKEENLTRRFELFHPKDDDQYLATLRWMVACGEERDIELINEAKRVGRFRSKGADALIHEAISRIRARSQVGVSDASRQAGLFVEAADQEVARAGETGPFDPSSLREWSMSIAAEAEATARRVQLVRPRNEAEYRRALYWANARGEKEELALVEEVEHLRPFCGGDLDPLIEHVKKNINSRLQVRRLVDELFAYEKAAVASDIVRLGVSFRGTVAPRGKLNRSAKQPVWWGDDQRSRAIALLRNSKVDLRQQVALVLGEWGGEEDAVALGEVMKREGWKTPEGEQFALYCIAGLKNIGGYPAVRALCDALAKGTVMIQLTALNAIEDLATGGSEVFGEGIPHFDPPRGRYYRQVPPAPGTEEITKTLEKSMNEAESPAVRERSRELLEHVLV